MRLEGFLSLLGCVVLVVALGLGIGRFWSGAHARVAALEAPDSRH